MATEGAAAEDAAIELVRKLRLFISVDLSTRYFNNHGANPVKASLNFQ